MNYFFKVGVRLMKNESFLYCLNVLGMSVGLTGIILLYLFIDNETSFDKFHKNYQRIYRITTVFVQGTQEDHFALNEGLWDEILVQDVPGVSYSTAFLLARDPVNFVVDGNFFSETGGIFSDEDFLKVFDFEVLSGSRDFKDPNGIIITRNMAMKYFGAIDVVGRVVELRAGNQPILLKITAVLEDIPINSSISFQYIISGKFYGDWWTRQFEKTNRQGNTLHIYFKTTNDQGIVELQSNVDKAFYAHKGQPTTYFTPVQRLADVHFNSNNQFELAPGGNKDYLNVFIFIAIGFAFITVANSVNMNNSRFFKRVKEVGVRRLLGCGSKSLGQLFILDSILTVILAFFLSVLSSLIILLNVDLKIFSIEPGILLRPSVLFRIFLVFCLLGFLIGVFPAIKASSLSISNALKGKIIRAKEKIYGVRNSALILQIGSAAIMFALSLIVFRQINYLHTKPMGYNKNNLIYFQKQPVVSYADWLVFRDKLRELSVISSVGGCSKPFLGSLSTAQFKGPEKSFLAQWYSVDKGFLETMEISLVDGAAFSNANDTLRYEMIMNESARKELDVQNPIGNTLSSWFGEGKIVGIARDFHFKSFNAKIAPLVLVLDPRYNPVIYARYKPGEHKDALEGARRAWNSFSTGTALEFQFFDDSFNKMLEKEHQTRLIIVLFTFISIIVTSIGLTGLIGYIATEFRQEIAIRKVLGASVAQILLIFSIRFIYLITIALIVAIPSIKWLSETWLSNFEYKVYLLPSDFIIPSALIVLLTIAVVSRQAVAAANVSPIKVLRNE